MLVKERNRREIEARLNGMGEYVKIDYLSSCLKQQLDFDTRKFVLLELADVYESKRMFSDAGKIIQNAAAINTTISGKISDFVKAGNLFVRGGNFDEADSVFDKALATCANDEQRRDVKKTKRNLYKSQAEFYFTVDKRKNAMTAYEKLLSLDLDMQEKREAQEKLLLLYEKLGKIRDYYNLKKTIN